MKNSILIIKKSSGVQPQQMELDGGLSITAESGVAYSLVDSATGIYPEGVVLQKEDEALQVIVNGEVLLVINDYFEEGKEVSFDEFGAHLSATDFVVIQQDDTDFDSPIWDAQTDTVVTLDDKDDAIDATLPSDMRPPEDSIAQGGAMDANLKEQPEDQPVPDNQGVEGEMGWGWYAAAALGLGALAGGGSGGGSSSDGGSGSTSSTTISSAAGIFFSTVQIDLYDASGDLISSVEHDYSTGDYVYTGSYSGPMLVEITDINGTETDYTDETTGEEKSLGTSLRAMTTTDGSSDKAISVTPLTELATQIAGVTPENRSVTADNVEVNSKVATLFGLDDILEKPAVVTEDTSSADAASIKYGQALAILSGADSEAGNASAAETIATIADSLKEANSDTEAPLKLTSEVADILTKGLEAFNDGPTGRDNVIESSFSFSSVPVLVDADGDAIKVINAEVVDSTIKVKIKGVSADEVVTLTVGENTTNYTVLASDVVEGYAYVPISSGWFSAADGNYDVVVTVDDIDSTTTVTVDTTAPEAPAFELHQDTGESDSDGITSDTSVDVTLADGVTNWQYSLDGGSTWISRTSGSSFELKGETTYAVGDIQVKQVDKAGNESNVTSNDSTITTLETSAPDLSFEDTGTSNSDGITNNTTVSVTFDEGVDLASWQYSLDAGSTWTNGTGTSFELTANTTYQADTIQVKQIDSEGNEELSALSSKIVTDTIATTPVIFLATDSGQSQSDGITNDTTYRVKLAKDTESWEYSLDSGANWVTGSGTSFELNENQTYAAESIQVRQTDTAGNVSAIKSNDEAITTDVIAPGTPSASLHDDTGANDEDGITNDTRVDVTLSEDAVSWQYSLDGGSTWSASQEASETSFELADNTTYAIDSLQVRQYDSAGNVSVVDSNDQVITLDSVVSAPTLDFSLTSNELTSTTVTVTLADDVASWEYSLDAGETWSDGSGERFSLEPLTSYDANAIQVRQTDVAGNVSDTAINEALETDVAIDPPSFELASDTGVSDEDFITSAMTVNVALLGGDEGAVSWNYSLDGGETWSADQDISTTSFELMDNTTYDIGQIVVTQTDAENNTSAYAINDDTVIIDSNVDAPMFSLNADTGSSVSDGITNDLVINVDLADDVSTWQYSLDSGSTWLDGEATSFELDANTTYDVGAIQVKQTDLAGNESLAYQNSSAITTDTQLLAAPTFSLNSDSGSSTVDNITNDALINVALSEDAVSWQYSTDAGLTWQEGTGTSFELAANITYAVDDIQVQQLDAAGNVSEAGLNEAAIEIDTVAIAPDITLNLDSGIDDSDGITNDVEMNFDSIGEVRFHPEEGTVSISQWASREYSLDGGETWTEVTGDSFSLEENQTYTVGMIQARQTDVAGNVSAVGSNSMVIVTDTIPLAAPTFALHADTGESDSDFITSDTTIDVTLSDDAASWQYSLDSGATWSDGTGTSFEMGALQTYDVGQIQVRQADLAGNISVAVSNEVVFESDSLPAPEVALAEDTGLSDSDNITSSLTMNVTLDVNATSWQYSLDGGANWADGEGSSFELDANTTYAAESIQVKQFDADDNESATFSNDSDVTTDTESQLEEDIYLASDNSISTVIADGDDQLYGVERYRLGENGDFVVSWIKDDEDAGDTLLMVQRYNADGSEMSLPYAVPIPTYESEDYYSVEDITPVGADGAVVITWVGESYNEDEDYYDETNLYFQLFDAAGQPVGEIQQATATEEWIRDSQIISLAETDQFIASWTEDGTDDTVAYLQLFDSTTGEEGALLTFDTSVVASVLPTGNNGEFIVLWNEVVSFEDASAIVKAQTYSSDGIPIGSTIVLNPEAGEYSDGMRLLGEDGAFIALMINEQDMTMSLQLVNDNGSLGARVDLSEFSDLVDLEVGIAILNSDNDFAVTWIGVSETDEPVIYTQSFMADGTPQNDPIALPLEFNADTDYDLSIESASAVTDEGYFITVDYSEENNEYDSFIAAGVYFVDGNSVTEIAASEDDAWAYFDLRVLNDAGDVLVFKEGQDDETSDTDSWVQIYGSDGAAKTDLINFTGNIYNVEWAQLNSEGDFFISWVESSGYYDEEQASWVNEVTHHVQMFNADGTSITPIEIEQGDDLPVSVAEAGAAYLVSLSDSASITTLSDILALEEGNWSSVEVGADTDHVLNTEGLPVGQYVVYATDEAGNITLNTTVVTISAELLAEPDVELNEDTGTYDDDEITNDTQVNVTLTDDAVRWEYSLDHGANWTEGEGASFNLTENTTFNYYDIQIRQYDADDNVSEIATNSDGYVVTDNIISDPQIEVVGNSVLVTLDDDQNEWYYSLVGGGEDENNWTQGVGDSFSLAPNTTYNAGDIVVYVEDIASNEAEFVYQQQVVTGDAYEAPSFELFEDTGFSDSDGVTSEGSLNVFLADDAVAYEYSLDAGVTWQHGVGAYILLDEGETFPASDFVGYQYDAEGNETELLTSYSEEHLDEDIDFAIGFLLAEGTVSWRYSKDGGETFAEVVWADADGHFIDLEYGEEYAIEDIQVRQIRSTGEVSAIATNGQVIVIDDYWPDLVVAPNYEKLEGGIEHSGNGVIQDQKVVKLGNTGDSIVVWTEITYSESGDERQLVLQRLNSDGESISGLLTIQADVSNASLILEEIIPLGETGAYIVSWYEHYESGSSAGEYYYQIFNEHGAVGSPQSLVNYSDSYNDSYITAVGDSGSFVVLDSYSTYDENTDTYGYHRSLSLMDVEGNLVSQLLNSNDFDVVTVTSIGEEGHFVVNQGNSEVQLYSALGQAIGEVLPADSSYTDAFILNIAEVGDTGSYIVFSSRSFSHGGEDQYQALSAQVFTSTGAYQGTSSVIANTASGSYLYGSGIEATSIGNDQIVVSWRERDPEGGAGSITTYMQRINADGSLSGDALVLFESLSSIAELEVHISEILAVGDQGNYIVRGVYSDNNNISNGFSELVKADGSIVSLHNDEVPTYRITTVGEDGSFVVAWNESDDNGTDISVQLYDADGTPSGDTVSLEANAYSYDRDASIVDLGNGEFAVSWMGDTYNQNGTSTNVYIQKFNADGSIVDKTIIDTRGEVSVESNDDGFAYLVNSSLFESDFLSDDDQWEEGLFDVTLNAGESFWNSVDVSAGEQTSISAEGLESGTYYVLVADLAGNVHVSDVGITVNEAPTEIVFDLTTGESTDLDGQVFDADETYDIYINVGDGSHLTFSEAVQWSGADNLGDDDTIILVSDDSVTSFSADSNDDITWSVGSSDMTLTAEGEFSIDPDSFDLWENAWASNPDAGLSLSQVIAAETPDV